MRLLLQRVSQASVTVDGEVVGAIEQGILALLGIHHSDTEADIPWLVKKLTGLRIFSDEAGKMNLSVQDIDGGILLVSQFTLYASCKSGRRPDLFHAAKGENARVLYDSFVEQLRAVHPRLETGRFAAMMDVALVNDGPVTLIVDRDLEI